MLKKEETAVRKKIISCILCAGMLLSSANISFAQGGTDKMDIYGMQTESMENPIGIDDVSPSFRKTIKLRLRKTKI